MRQVEAKKNVMKEAAIAKFLASETGVTTKCTEFVIVGVAASASQLISLKENIRNLHNLFMSLFKSILKFAITSNLKKKLFFTFNISIFLNLIFKI